MVSRAESLILCKVAWTRPQARQNLIPALTQQRMHRGLAVPLSRQTARRERVQFQFSAKTNTLLPRLKSSWVFPPAATAIYCLPLTI